MIPVPALESAFFLKQGTLRGAADGEHALQAVGFDAERAAYPGDVASTPVRIRHCSSGRGKGFPRRDAAVERPWKGLRRSRRGNALPRLSTTERGRQRALPADQNRSRAQTRESISVSSSTQADPPFQQIQGNGGEYRNTQEHQCIGHPDIDIGGSEDAVAKGIDHVKHRIEKRHDAPCVR